MAKRKSTTKPKPQGNLKKLQANQFGIEYAKENFEYYQTDKEFDWTQHLPRLMVMCASCYKIQTADDKEDNVEEAVKQAVSTWNYLWKSRKGLDKKEKSSKVEEEKCEWCEKFEMLGFSCTKDIRECDCPVCAGFCECEREE